MLEKFGKEWDYWEIVKEASEVDRAGSVVLDYLLISNFIKPVDRSLSDIREVILTRLGKFGGLEGRRCIRKRCKTYLNATMSIQVLVANFTRATSKVVKGRMSKWCKAPEGYVAINVDAGFDMNLGTGSVGAVIRDDNGQFIAASNQKLTTVIDAATVEATTVLHGLYLLIKLGYTSW